MLGCCLSNVLKRNVFGKGTPVTILSKDYLIYVKHKKMYSIRINRGDKKESNMGFLKWVLLAIPVTSFGLGCWQVQRRQWKLNLIKTLKERTSAPPTALPENFTDLDSMEYRTVRVSGHFQHDKEFTIGPRAVIDQKDIDGATSFFKDTSNSIGYLVITPFKLSNRDDTILINRGWVHHKLKKQSSRPDSLITEVVKLEGVIRLQEKRGQFMPKNDPSKEQWMYRDLQEMSRIYDTAPVWLDAKGPVNNSIRGWPVPNQTRISVRNEHASYIITWFGLCGCTSWMWFRLFINKLPLP